MITILLIICLLFEIGQALDIITTHIALKSGIKVREVNPLFKKIVETRKIPFYCIFNKCITPIVLFIVIGVLFSYKNQVIPSIFLIITVFLTITAFLVSLNNIIIIIGENK